MPWTKSGDTAASYPRLLAVDELRAAEDWSVNEVTGFIARLFWHSAGHMTDYEVGFGDVKLFGNGRHEQLVDLATSVGLMSLIGGQGRGRRWRLLQDPEFVHVRLRSEVEWERQRDRDRKNTDLTMPVRLRDGDACRYCGVVVNWNDRKSGRGATFDHLAPGESATVDTYVVSCRSCNSARKADPGWDAEHPLLDPPTIPHYSDKTREMLEAFFGPERVAARLSEPTPDPARAAQAAAERPGMATAGRQAPEPAHAHHGAVSDPQTPRPGPDHGSDQKWIPDSQGGNRVGSGRDGSGQVGKGRDGSGQVGGQPAAQGSRRARRGRRSRRSHPTQTREGT